MHLHNQENNKVKSRSDQGDQSHQGKLVLCKSGDYMEVSEDRKKRQVLAKNSALGQVTE